ncbi:type II toxin-antitoxin system VapC family toxin [Nocardiopsis sp. YSL2]|uniref:type II toxin-antitoxin system VapC family toxin n=1 Tax=Nocardiopsis sp. YSL2 TaxID=2939492 RepID=UPI0026F4340C|nr:type II toxin-antitoxin system VapC family toxin [Nocardiopsis sp. YSL2]
MSLFADSSAVVKLYAAEHGSDAMLGLTDPVVLSQLTQVEVPAALWKKQRMGELSVEDTGILVSAFEADYFGTPREPRRFSAAVVSAEILEEAVRLTAVHGLRAYDAVQLASAKAVRSVDPRCTVFAVFDKDLREAAAMEGFRLFPED